jgi:hypothetical protein
MKTMRHTFGGLALAVSLLFTGCQKEDAQAPADLEFASAEFQLPDLADLETPEVTMGTETAEFKCTPREASKEKMELLKRALKNLNLDENQRTAVKGFVQQHHACIAEHMTKIKELHTTLLARANAAREDYVKAYKAGRITKAQLEEKLTQLRASLREEMTKHDVKQTHMRILRRCRQELLQKIESVLNPTQLQKWNNWKSQLG